MPEQKQGLYRYYDERAEEYDEFYSGGGPASIRDPEAYREEVRQIAALLPDYIAGKHIDLACGTGFWIPYYHEKCSQITLIDQSEQMLRQCSLRAERLGISHKTLIIRGDVFAHPLLNNRYDSALIGFLNSHLNDAEENRFLKILREILRPNGRFVIIDSVWTDERGAVRSRDSLQKRHLNDGREYEIYKRYFTKKDFEDMAKEHEMNLTVVQEGRVFITATGTFACS
ncbi:MAG: class I SAM-dependent methyltransferase [Chloroflexota bacterium]|nr:MAG: class I SAM-dependent methyltransferase [Chloroflexota bacterium]